MILNEYLRKNNIMPVNLCFIILIDLLGIFEHTKYIIYETSQIMINHRRICIVWANKTNRSIDVI